MENYKRQTTPQPVKPPDYHSPELFNQTLGNYEHNSFVQYLKTIFPAAKVDELCSMYQIGTSKHWNGSPIFWQVNESGRIHAGNVIAYNPTTGRRIKKPYYHFTWLHQIMEMDFKVNPCLYGLHLTTLFPKKPIGIVESEKTAIIAAGYLPNYLWLATGGYPFMQNWKFSFLKPEKFKPLAGRKVVLFPTTKRFDEWNLIMANIKKENPSIKITISDLLQRHATPDDVEARIDLADYLLRTKPPKPPLPPKQFRQPEPVEPEPGPQTKVVNVKNDSYDIYIGRANRFKKLPQSKWHNPFSVKEHGRQKALELFRQYITTGKGKHLLNDLNELKGKTLGCWCKPDSCHGDILKELIENGIPQQPNTAEFITICEKVKAGTPIPEAVDGWDIGDGSMYQLEYLAALAKFSNFKNNKYLQN